MGHVVTPSEQKSTKSSTKSVSKTEERPTVFRFHGPHSSPSNGLAHAVTRAPSGGLLRTGWSECLHGCCALLPEKYGDVWRRCFEQLLHGDGPLPEHWRIYIAILAICRHEVSWAVRALSQEFIAAGGDRTWLSGQKFAPKKLKSLASINKILAHRPWVLTKEHIIDLTKGEASWSLSELCQAICILTHFHALASFLHVCLPQAPSVMLSKLTSSVKSPSTPTSLPLTPRSSPAKCNVTTVLSSSLPSMPSVILEMKGIETKEVVKEDDKGEKLKESEDSKMVNGRMTSKAPSPIPIPSKDEKVQNSSTIIGSKREIQASPQPSKQIRNEPSFTPSYSHLRDFAYLCDDLGFTYEDFPHGKDTFPLFKIREYNWQDHGYCTIQRLFSEMGNILDERFQSIKTLTHPVWAAREGPIHYRRAVWNYAQSLFGIHHDEYRYSHISELLSRDVQSFIKKCFCAPMPDLVESKIPKELLGKEDLKASQLIPVTVLLMEARIQSELLYALKVIIPHQH